MPDDRSTARRPVAPAATAFTATAVALALATSACSSDSPTQPSDAATAAATLNVAAAARSTAGALIDDASGRLMPSLADATARARLRGFLDDLSAALEAGDGAKARRQIAHARKVIAAMGDSPDAADLAVLGITLDQVEAQFDGPPAIQQEP
jgi:hypothetical protein